MFAANVRRRRKMPQLSFSTLFTANQLGVNPVSGWQYEYLPWPAQIIILMRSTTTGNRVTVYSGSETIQERSPVQAGGTIGVTPSELNTPAISFLAAAGDRLKLVIEEACMMNLAATGDAGAVLQFGAVGVDLGTINTGVSRFDPRGNATGAIVFSSASAVATNIGGNKLIFNLAGQPAAGSFFEAISTDIQELPLLPGDGIQFQGAASSTTEGAMFWWRERFLEESESK